MSEMVERLARRLCENFQEACAEGGIPVLVRISWDDATPLIRAHWISQARAALRAIRDPTEEMVKEAYYEALAENALGVWQTMIDEALK